MRGERERRGRGEGEGREEEKKVRRTYLKHVPWLFGEYLIIKWLPIIS